MRAIVKYFREVKQSLPNENILTMAILHNENLNYMFLVYMTPK